MMLLTPRHLCLITFLHLMTVLVLTLDHLATIPVRIWAEADHLAEEEVLILGNLTPAVSHRL